jgi:hypothetical protein
MHSIKNAIVELLKPKEKRPEIKAISEKYDCNLQDIYELWRRFMKRSIVYQKVCEFMRSEQLSHNSQMVLLNVALENKLQRILGPDEEVMQQIKNYAMFDDVFRSDFSEWWQHRRDQVLEVNSGIPLAAAGGHHGAIRYYGDILEDDIDYCIGRFAEEHGREPNASELKLYLRQRLRHQERQRLTIAIEHPTASINVINKRLSRHLKQKFNQSDIKAYRSKRGSVFRPTTYRIKDVEMEDYLGIHDCIYQDGLTIEEAILKVGPGKEKRILRADKPEGKAVIEKYQGRLAKANRIIRNVEDGEFPGNY